MTCPFLHFLIHHNYISYNHLIIISIIIIITITGIACLPPLLTLHYFSNSTPCSGTSILNKPQRAIMLLILNILRVEIFFFLIMQENEVNDDEKLSEIRTLSWHLFMSIMWYTHLNSFHDSSSDTNKIPSRICHNYRRLLSTSIKPLKFLPTLVIIMDVHCLQHSIVPIMD